ncbi:hypothetical protein B0H16DRAFT_1464433 [Mycena metata]|uniref:Uncharacterized protein n=1 Tax=Mycena metata TaxID=1033252 RepID=A0AAD7IF68_9AGAR|nr:hypothetical protein B0H16DRAFT_1464433 [Mycena metata]
MKAFRFSAEFSRPSGRPSFVTSYLQTTMESSIATHTRDSANVNLDNISGLPRIRSTCWPAFFSEGLHLFAAQRPTVAANLLAQYSSELTHLWAEFDQAAIIGNISMLDKARVAIQTCIQLCSTIYLIITEILINLQTLINNIEQDNGAEPATQQGTMGTEEESDDEIPELVWDDEAVVGR